MEKFLYLDNNTMNTKKHKAESKVKPHAISKKEASKTEKRHVAYSFSDTVSYVSDFEMVYNYKPYYTDDISLLTQSKRGLNAKAALDFLTLSGFTQDEFQETFKTTVKTIQNHVTRELTLDAAISEKLLKSFALFDKGSMIFGSASNFHQWLNMPAYGLGNQLPFDLMDTITGIQLIEEELIRIESGDLA